MIPNTTIHELNTGATIPALGFGTWQDTEAQESAVLEALKAGVSSTPFPFPRYKREL